MKRHLAGNFSGLLGKAIILVDIHSDRTEQNRYSLSLFIFSFSFNIIMLQNQVEIQTVSNGQRDDSATAHNEV